MKTKTVTIGIPAYNEESNITSLLNDLAKQKINNFILEKTIVISDGSTDQTVAQARAVNKTTVIDDKQRKGLATRLNEIVALTNSDILIIINADTRIKDQLFLEKLVEPILTGKADLTAPSVTEAQPTGFFEEILFVSTKIKNLAFEKFNQGNNVYTCRGVARAFTKDLYKKITFSKNIGDDAYSYFYCVTHGFRYYFVAEAKIIFKLPENLQDHANQSLRFFRSQELMKKEFGKDFISKSYQLPPALLLGSFIENFLTSPIHTTLYVFVFLALKLKSLLINPTDNWNSVNSSKKITI